MASIEIKAARMGKIVAFSLPCRERELKENLTALYGTPPSHAVIEVAQVSFPKELEMLTGQMLDLDALNYLARRMDGFDFGEADTFYEGIKAEGITRTDATPSPGIMPKPCSAAGICLGSWSGICSWSVRRWTD